MPRYVLGPGFGRLDYPAEPVEPVAKFDLYPAVVSAEPYSGIVLDYPPFDPAVDQAPTKTLVYLLPDGHPQPEDALGWINSPHPCSCSDAPISPDGEPAYHVPAPVAPPGVYYGQVVLEFPD